MGKREDERMKEQPLTKEEHERIDKIVEDLAEACKKATLELATLFAERRHLKKVGVKEIHDAAKIVFGVTEKQ
jgi:hypothetical protein